MHESLETILPLLRDPDAEVRWEALKQLGALGEDAPLEPLLAALHNDPHLHVRRTALRTLGKLGVNCPVEILIATTHDPDLGSAAVGGLGALGERAPMDVLIASLYDPELTFSVLRTLRDNQLIERLPVQSLIDLYEYGGSRRHDLLRNLNAVGQFLPLDFLERIISEEYDPYYREQIALVLSQIQDENRLAVLIEAASARYWGAHEAALRVLGLLPQNIPVDLLLKVMSEGHRNVSAVAAEVLADIADQVPRAALLDLLRHERANVRVYALNVLTGCSDEPPLEEIVVALKDADEHVRAAAIYLCKERDTGLPLSCLIEATLDTSETVCIAAVEALGVQGKSAPEQAFVGLVSLLQSTRSGVASVYSVSGDALPNALLKLGPLVPVEVVLQAFLEVEGEYHLAQLLGRLGEQAPFEQLIAALRGPSENLRRYAAQALGATGSPIPVPALLHALQSLPDNAYAPDRQVIIEALCSLWQYVPGEVFLTMLRKKQTPGDTPAAILSALKNKGEHIPADLLMGMLHEHLHSRDFDKAMLAYLESLDQLPSVPVEELLPAIAPLEWQYAADRSQEICRQLPLQSLLDQLAHQDENVRCGVLTMLRCVPEPVPLEPVIKLLDDYSVRVRIAAVACLRAVARPFPAELFTRILADPSNEVRRELLEHLELDELGIAEAIDEIIARLDDTDPWNRLWVLDILGKPGIIERVPVEVFVQSVGTHYAYPDQLTFALEALRAKDPRLALEQAILALGYGNRFVYQTAFEIIQEFCPVLVSEIAQEAMAILTGEAAGRFFAARNAYCLAELIGYAAHASPRLLARLGELLSWPYWPVRWKAVCALGMLHQNIPETIIQRLSELLDDPASPAVRRQAKLTLTAIRSSQVENEEIGQE